MNEYCANEPSPLLCFGGPRAPWVLGAKVPVRDPDGHALPFIEQGGVPIKHGEHVIGAIGVSGAKSAQQDEEVAYAGARAIADKKAGEMASQPVYGRPRTTLNPGT